jgi:hypothetical protein
MQKQTAKDVITDGSNTTIIVDDTSYEKQLIGSAQANLNKMLQRFVNLPLKDKEKVLARVRALRQELEDG